MRRPRHDRPLTPAELREYLAGLNEKDPNQLMDAVSEGSLIQGLVLATLATTVLLLAFTIGPYAWDNHVSQSQAGGPQSGAAKVASQAAPAESPAAANPAPAEATVAGPPAVSKKALGGVDEVKQSDPNVNPLDSKIDDLFDKTR